MPEAVATFERTMWEPTLADAPPDGPAIHRIAVEKRLSGDLDGAMTGVGATCRMDAPEEGAAYTVMDRFTGRLAGRSGGFVVMHTGIAAPGERPVSTGQIVPGSGTGGLDGIRGEVAFEMPHRIVFRYDLP